jgi:hypothetical protein
MLDIGTLRWSIGAHSERPKRPAKKELSGYIAYDGFCEE